MKKNLILISILVVLSFFLAIKYSSQKDEYIDVEIISSAGEWWYSERFPPHWLAESLTIGATEISPSGKKIAEILDLNSYEEGANRLFLVKVRLLVSKNAKNNTYRFKQQPLLIGSAITILPQNTRLMGNVVTIFDGNTSAEEKTLNIIVKLYDRYPWFANQIKVGDRYVDPLSNKTQVEVTKKEVVFADMPEGFENLHKAKDITHVKMAAKEIFEVVKNFGEDEQEVFALHYLSDLSYKGMSKIAGKSEGALRVAVHRLNKKIRSTIHD